MTPRTGSASTSSGSRPNSTRRGSGSWTPSRAPPEPIAIVAMGCRFPGGALARGPVAAGRRGPGRDLRVPGRPRLGRRDAVRPRPGRRRAQLRPRGRLPARGRPVRPRLLRHQPPRGAGHRPAAAAAAGDRVGGAGARRASTRRPCAAAGPACSPASCTATTAPRLQPGAAGFEGYIGDRQRRQRRLGPHRVHARLRGPGRHRGHGVLVLAGRAAPGRARRCATASATWRWPAG